MSGVTAAHRHGSCRPVLIVDQRTCDGCGECVIACEAARRLTSPGSGACIAISAPQEGGIWFPLVCQQCQDAPCVRTCPTGALSLDQMLPAVILDRDRCVGCAICTLSCPFGAIRLDVKGLKSAKCDLCGGDPACVKRCRPGALVLGQPHALGKKSRARMASRLMRSIRGG